MKPSRLLIFFGIVLVPKLLSAQCAMCRAVLESEANGGAAEAINDGIVYLMIFPYLLMGGIAYAVWRLMRKRKSEN